MIKLKKMFHKSFMGNTLTISKFTRIEGIPDRYYKKHKECKNVKLHSISLKEKYPSYVIEISRGLK